MDKDTRLAGGARAFLSDNIEKFVSFASQVIHNEDFLKCTRKLLPFDGMAYAPMNMMPGKQVVRKMGVMIMRMDLSPALFSLAVTITTERGNNEKPQDISVFLAACKTIDELQEYVGGAKFKEEVVELCSDKIAHEDELLHKITSSGMERINNVV